jgi:putative ABC transport system permease protein
VISAGRLAWLQLRREKVRLLVAVAGVAFAVVLMLMQLGFQDALFNSSVNVHRHVDGDVFLLNPHYNILALPKFFPRRRLYQALAFDGVASVTPLYTMIVRWQNPATGATRDMFAVGIDPVSDVLDGLPEVAAQRAKIREPDVVLFDELSRPEYGPVAATFRSSGPLATEVNQHGITVGGLFRLGTSFGVDGSIVTSDLNLLRMVPARPQGAVSIGVVRVRSGVDPRRVRAALEAALPRDVVVLTKQEYIDREIDYWSRSTPIGYVFTFGVAMGLVVGTIIVYQILFADVADHLPEYATLKAIGYSNRYLAGVVVMEATILAVVGYIPGLAVCAWLYRLTRSATMLPMMITLGRGIQILILTAAMCWMSALIAMRKLRSADPADVF